jgi:hypothetical protein
MVLDGRLEISIDGVSTELGRGTLAHFDPYERRIVTAKTDVTVIYLLAPWPGPGHPSSAEARARRHERALRGGS